ncbi:hypothetical protein SUSAZ_10490 [Sulfolobus acidocaldarius SUSAZ]|nr:hypothetical protein SUSAZ_10490 [Sulfolobus acidocaldarius SUSAZ]
MKPILLVALAAIGLTSGILIAGVSGYGPLAYISYHVVGVSNSNSSIQLTPVFFSLGNITPGQSGEIKLNTTLIVNANGTYVFQLLHEEKLNNVFSSFNVTLNISGKVVTLSLDNDHQALNLTTGKYNVVVTLSYTVSEHPHGDLNVKREPLIIVHPAQQENESED